MTMITAFRCLIVDDLPIQRKGLSGVLSSYFMNFTCEAVETGDEAVDKVNTTIYDIIVMDYFLGNGEKGADVARRILSGPNKPHIIGFTDCPDAFDDCKSAGMKDVLSKNWLKVRDYIEKFMSLKQTDKGIK